MAFSNIIWKEGREVRKVRYTDMLDVELVRHEHGLLYIYLIFLPISVHCTAPHISAYYHNTEM